MYSVHCRRSKIKRRMVECESEKESTVVGNGGLEGRACSWVFPAWDLGSLRESQSAVADVPGGGTNARRMPRTLLLANHLPHLNG